VEHQTLDPPQVTGGTVDYSQLYETDKTSKNLSCEHEQTFCFAATAPHSDCCFIDLPVVAFRLRLDEETVRTTRHAKFWQESLCATIILVSAEVWLTLMAFTATGASGKIC
jgi:hypothetical protein